MSIFWTTEGDSWIKQRNAYINARLGPDPYHLDLTPDVYNPDLDRQYAEWKQQWNRLEDEWFSSLPPDQAKQAYDAFAARSASFDKSFKIGKALSLSIIAAAAGGAALTASGVIGGAAPAAAGAAEAGAAGGISAADAAAVLGGAAGESVGGMGAITLAEAAGATTAAAGIGAADAAAVLGGAAGDSVGGMGAITAAQAAGGLGSVASTVGSVVTAGQGLLDAVGGVGGLINAGLGVVGAVTGAQALKDQAEEDQATALYNSQEAEAAARNALLRGEEDARDIRRKGSMIEGEQRATFAARGLVLEDGSPRQALSQTRFFTDEDMATVRKNAATEASTYRRQGSRFQAAAGQINPSRTAGLSLVSNLATVASRWYDRYGSSKP